MGVKTAQELIDIIKENDLLEYVFHGLDEGWVELEYDYEEFENDEEYLKSLGLENFEPIESREDTAEFWSVIHFKNEDIYLRIDGEYDSYGQGDHEYDSIKQVFPKQVTQTIYES